MTKLTSYEDLQPGQVRVIHTKLDLYDDDGNNFQNEVGDKIIVTDLVLESIDQQFNEVAHIIHTSSAQTCTDVLAIRLISKTTVL